MQNCYGIASRSKVNTLARRTQQGQYIQLAFHTNTNQTESIVLHNNAGTVESGLQNNDSHTLAQINTETKKNSKVMCSSTSYV